MRYKRGSIEVKIRNHRTGFTGEADEGCNNDDA
jgi:hypothetical protein